MKTKLLEEDTYIVIEKFIESIKPKFSPSSHFLGPYHAIYLVDEKQARAIRQTYNYNNHRNEAIQVKCILKDKARLVLEHEKKCIETYLQESPYKDPILIPSMKAKVPRERKKGMWEMWAKLLLFAHRNYEIKLLNLMTTSEKNKHIELRKQIFAENEWGLLRNFLKKYSSHEKMPPGTYFFNQRSFYGESLDEFIINTGIPKRLLLEDKNNFNIIYDAILIDQR